MVYFTSDLHLGHKNICKYRKEFSTTKEHDEYLLTQIEALGKRDLLYVLGDFLFDCEEYDSYLERLGKSRRRMKLLLGNHDSRRLYNGLPKNIEVCLPIFSYKNMWLTHCPIHEKELRGRLGNIHGHLHLKTLKDDRYFNVNVDVNDYKFVPLDTIKIHFNKNKE